MINLQPITWDNWDAVSKLSVEESQKKYIASNEVSLMQAYVFWTEESRPPMAFAIYNGEELVGFTMFVFYDESDYQNDDQPFYHLWRFMIDKEHQGKGYGKAAMVKVLEYLKTMPQGKAPSIYLSYDRDNHVARKLYASLGFVETGEIKYDETVARLLI